MNHLAIVLGLAACVSAGQSANAGELRPIEAYPLRLGSLTGTVYFDVQGADDRLVATLSNGPDAIPVRMITTLTAGQSTTFSVPGALGRAALEVTFIRHGDKVFAVDADVVGSLR